MAVDVAIVGGGPAGAAAAYFLARGGRSVTVVEQKTFPRDKTCGDGLTPRAIRMLADMGLGDRVEGWQRVEGLRIRSLQHTRTAAMPATRRWCDHGLVTPRRVLDQLVLDNAEAAGATVRYGTKALRVVTEQGTVCGIVVRSRGRETPIRAGWVVCAEGAAGTVLRTLGRAHNPDHPMGLALRQYSPSGPARLEWFDVSVDLRENGALLPGYGWAFPMADGAVNVGVGLLNTALGSHRVGLHTQLDRFVGRLVRQGVLAADAPARDRRGGRLFMGGSVWPPDGRGYVLVGDAAGMINPATGEGIAYAYETGRIAARHVHAALETGARILPGYTGELERIYGTYHQVGRGLVNLIADPRRMDRLMERTMATDRRLQLALTLLLNLHDPSMRTLDQFAVRALLRLASATRWEPPPTSQGLELAAAMPRP